MNTIHSKYCPFCRRHIEPFRGDDGEIFIYSESDDPLDEGGMVYIHDEVPHDEDYNFKELQ